MAFCRFTARNVKVDAVGAMEHERWRPWLLRRTPGWPSSWRAPNGGEEVVITRAGRPVAKLVLAKGERDIERAREAGKRIRALAKEMNLGPFDWEEWKKYRDEGRR
jgi:antitoxin (DNA-binding transcriptional repressor) of toxin-antitoxin stability system